MAVGELQPPKKPVDPLIGQVLSERYRVIKKLGEGGMGAVYLAEHVFIEKKVALKVLALELASKAELTARFLQEAKSASRIGHENVIDISDFGQTPEGFVFFAMECLDGADLGETLRKDGALPWKRARPILLQICKALRAAHKQGIIHRDMKPENIFLIEKEGRKDFVKLLDFGIAKVQSMGEGADEGPRLTKTGMIFGTPEYMAPEQAEGRVCDQRADIYAMGCVMYHVLTGSAPFSADNFMAMLTKHLVEEAVKPSARRPDLHISPAIDDVVMAALVKNRDKRTPNMDAFIRAIEEIPADPVPAASVTAGPGARVAAAAKGSVKNAATRQLGGGEADVVIATTPRSNTTQMIEEGDVAESSAVLPSRRSGGIGLMVVGGLILGAIVAVGIVLMRGGGASDPAATATQPASVQPTPNQVPAPVPPPVATSPAAVPTDPGGTPATATGEGNENNPGGTGEVEDKKGGKRRHPRPHRRIELDEPVTEKKAPELKTPAELKGFPGE